MLPSFGRCTATSWLTKKIEVLRQIRAAGSDEGPNDVPASGRGLDGEHEERRVMLKKRDGICGNVQSGRKCLFHRCLWPIDHLSIKQLDAV
jgi:hypothetical protein